MTNKERFERTLRGEAIGGQVPTFELVFFLTMEAFGKVHPSHRHYEQWNQMSTKEKQLQMKDMARIYIQTAETFGHSAIFAHPNPWGLEGTKALLEEIRNQSGEEYSIMMHGDTTYGIPDGNNMMEFSAQLYEEPEVLHEQAKKNVENALEFASKVNADGKLLNGFALCSDYCFNVNPFFNTEMFDEFVVPYLKETIAGYRDLGYYSIKHTDGNIMPIVKQMADCKPDALHSLDPQGGVDMTEVRKIVGPDMCLIGNVNCGLLQTGTEEECEQDVIRSLKQGMENGRGYIFSTSNCAYTGLPLERYQKMIRIWREYGNYDNLKW